MTNGYYNSNYLFYATHISHIQVGIHRTMPRLERDISDQDKFINYINGHYDELQCKYKAFCSLNNYKWDWDIFQDTILKCYEAISKKGKLNDTSSQGIENYFFIAFKLNVMREGQYARNQKRDLNIDSDSINELYETWYNDNNTTSRHKLISDLFTDFSTLYIMTKVEENFPQEDFYLFKLKTLCSMTYKQIQDKTKAKKVRQRIVDIKNWLKSNITKDIVKEAFYVVYGNII